MKAPNRLNSEFTSPKESPGFMLWRVSNEWQREIREALKPLGLAHAQFVLLANIVWLEDQDIRVTQTLLSRRAVMDKMMVSDVVRALLNKQLIERSRHPTDARAMSIKATAQGVDLIKRSMKVVEQTNRKFFARSHLPTGTITQMLQSLSSLKFEEP